MDELTLQRPWAAFAGSEARGEAELTIDRLMSEHAGMVWRLLRRWGLSPSDADDATQTVFVIASRKLDLITANQARSFLYGTAVRVAGNTRRSNRRRREVAWEDEELEGTSHGDPEVAAELTHARALLDTLLAELSPKLRRALVLAEIEQLEIAEIAQLESIPVGTAASRLRLAREEFRAKLCTLHHRNPFSRQP
jgi:RNA polymerase sigma-70 factor, ECF subfamily